MLCLFARGGFRSLRGHSFQTAFLAVYNFHLLPVVSEFLAAIKAHHVGTDLGRGKRMPLAASFRDGEAEVLV